MASQKIYQPGEDIGPYRVLRVLATGGMSTVYEARPKPDLRSDLLRMGIERVAVKVPNLDGYSGDRLKRKQLVARVDREIKTLIRLMKRTQGHPNVVKLYDAGHEGGIPYYAMEYIDGITLEEAMVARPRFGQMMHVFGKLCGAVAFLHDQDICHRDIKPSNVVLRYEDGSPSLIDFNICLPPGERALTFPGELVGTPQYLSPEHALHWLSHPREVYLPAPPDDVWSLGVVLYDILTGGVPWGTPPDRREELLREIRDIVPLHPCEHYSKVPRPLGDAAMRLLEKDPEKRPANAFEALALAGEAAEGTDILGRIPARRPAPKPKKTGWTGALVRVATPTPAGSGTPPPPPSGGPAGRRVFRFKGLAALGALAVGVLVLCLVLRPGRNSLDSSQCTPSGPRTPAARLPEAEQPSGGTPVPDEESQPEFPADSPDAGVIASNPMPEEPLKGQKLSPCKTNNEVEKRTACWLKIEGKLPCHDGTYEDEGSCYLPVMLKPRRPSSVKK